LIRAVWRIVREGVMTIPAAEAGAVRPGRFVVEKRWRDGGLSASPRDRFLQARRAATTALPTLRRRPTWRYLETWSDMEIIRGSNFAWGSDPLGGALVHYLARHRRAYKVLSAGVQRRVDPTFRFNGRFMGRENPHGPSSRYAMHRLIALRMRYDCLRMRHGSRPSGGIVTGAAGSSPNNYLSSRRLSDSGTEWMACRCSRGKDRCEQAHDRIAWPHDGQAASTEVPVVFNWSWPECSTQTSDAAVKEAPRIVQPFYGRSWGSDNDGIAARCCRGDPTERAAIPGRLREALALPRRSCG